VLGLHPAVKALRHLVAADSDGCLCAGPAPVCQHGRVEQSVGSLASTAFTASAGSIAGRASAGSVASLGSVGCIASIGSLASIGSISSLGSVASMGSVGSIASIGSTGRVGAVFNVPVGRLLFEALLARWNR